MASSSLPPFTPGAGTDVLQHGLHLQRIDGIIRHGKCSRQLPSYLQCPDERKALSDVHFIALDNVASLSWSPFSGLWNV